MTLNQYVAVSRSTLCIFFTQLYNTTSSPAKRATQSRVFQLMFGNDKLQQYIYLNISKLVNLSILVASLSTTIVVCGGVSFSELDTLVVKLINFLNNIISMNLRQKWGIKTFPFEGWCLPVRLNCGILQIPFAKCICEWK